MSLVLAIMGESGSGKTTAMRNLNPKETYYIDCDGKGLSWKGWKTQYNAEAKNYARCDEPEKVRALIKALSEQKTETKYIVVDTLNGIMVADEMRRAKEKGYDKWQDLASCVYAIVSEANTYREDLTIIFICHSQTDRDDDGYKFTHIKTSGKKLDKIVLESKFTTVIYSKVVDGKFLFETQADRSTAKSPMGALENKEMTNDIVPIIEALKEFEKGE